MHCARADQEATDWLAAWRWIADELFSSAITCSWDGSPIGRCGIEALAAACEGKRGQPSEHSAPRRWPAQVSFLSLFCFLSLWQAPSSMRACPTKSETRCHSALLPAHSLPPANWTRRHFQRTACKKPSVAKHPAKTARHTAAARIERARHIAQLALKPGRAGRVNPTSAMRESRGPTALLPAFCISATAPKC
jgi:hypothetical protein